MYTPCMIIFSAVIFTAPLDIPYEIVDCSDCCPACDDDDDGYDYDIDDFVLTDLEKSLANDAELK